MSDVFDLRARVSADATPFNKAMDSSATSVSSALSAISSAASIFVGSGVVSAFSKATNAAYEFGQVMADISSISDVGIQQLNKNIKQLDNVYGSMSNVGNSIYNIISSGFDRSEEELLSIVKNVGQASKSIRADLYSTANVFTTVANAYNLSADQFKNIADLLFVTVKEGKAEGNELARTLGLVVNTASEAGLSFAEMSAVISTLSRTQTTSQAMIGFNQMLNAMIKPSKEAADTAAQFGIEFGAAALKSKGFTAIIKDMHDKLQGNVEAINKISGPIRAMRAVVSLTGKQYENFIDILEKAESQIGTGVAMEAFAKQTDTAKQALENLKVQIDKTFVGVGQDLEPITKWLTEFTEEFLKAFSNSDGIGKWSIYVTALLGSFKGIHKGYTTFKGLSTALLSNTDKTTTKAKTYADHMERAKNATKDAAIATSNISKNLTNAIVKFTNGKALGSEVSYQSKGYTPNTITDSQRANVLRTMQDRLAKAREAVASSQKAHTPNIKTFYDAKSGLQRAIEGRDIAQSKFFDAMDLRKEAQRLLKDKQWSAQNLMAQLPSFQRNSSYGKELQATLDAQFKKAQADVNHMMQLELGAREIYYKSEKSLADAQIRFDNASKAYSVSVSKLKQAQAELQSMAKAEKAIVTSYRNTARSKGTTESASRTTEDLTMTALQKANARKLKAARRSAMSFEQQDALIARYNRRFKKNYEYLGELTNRTGIDWKRSFAEILGKGGVLRKLYNGFFAVTSALAAWETGWAIGKSIGEKFKVADWRLTQWIAQLTTGGSGFTRDKQDELDAYNLKMRKRSAEALADRLLNAKKLTEAEHTHITRMIALADKQEEVRKWYDKLMGKSTPTAPTVVIKSDTEMRDEMARNVAQAQQKAWSGEYEANPATRRQIESMIEAQGLPKAISKAMLERYTSAKWAKGMNVTAQQLYDAEMSKLQAEKLDKNMYGPFAKSKRTYSDILKDIETLRKRGPEAFQSILDTIHKGATEIRRADAEVNASKRTDSARQAEQSEQYIAFMSNAKNRFEQARTASIDVSKYTEAYLSVGVLSEEALREASYNIKAFNEASINFEKRLQQYNEQRKYLTDLTAEMKATGMSDDEIRNATSDFSFSLETFRKDLTSERESLIKLAEQQSNYAKLSSEQSFEKARSSGIDTESEQFLRDRVNRYDDVFAQNLGVRSGETQLQKDLRLRRSRAYQEVADEAFNELMKSRESVRQNKVSAGIITESMATRGNIADLQEAMKRIKDSIATFERFRMSAPKDSVEYTYYSNRIADAQGKLTDTSIKLRGEFNKLSEQSNEVRKGLMNTIQGFTDVSNRLSIDNLTALGGRWTHGAAGRMNNNALWHSVNLASRMGGMVRSQPYMISTRSLPNRQKSAQMRQQAQGAVSASVDAWIMSQKYAEANVGKTVTDIFTFMKQNNTIVVRNK